MSHRYIFWIILFLVFTGIAQAQTGTIQGKIMTSDGAPIPLVNIAVKGTPHGTTTQEDGTYQIKNIKVGDYVLIISYLGLQTQEKRVQVTDSEAVSLDVQLPQTAQELQEIVVTDTRTLNEKAVTIGKIAIKPMDLPQSITVIDQAVLDRQQTLQLSDALKNVNGVYLMGTTGGTQEELAGRGFSFGSSNTFKNGIRYNNSIMPEVNSLERLEVLKGSSAILFGNVSAGGVLNLVTKKPKFQTGGELKMQVGSYDFYKPSLDMYGAINNSDKVAYRINTTYQKAASFRENVTSERFYINPSLLFKLGKQTELLVEGDYLSDNRTSDYGIGAINYTISTIPRNRFIGASWAYFDANQQSVTATVTHHWNERWQVRGVLAHQGYNTDLFGTTRPNAGTFVQNNGKWVRGIQRSKVNEKYNLAQIDVTGELTTGFLKHTLLVGADADQYDTKTTAFNNITKYDSINILNLEEFKQRNDIPELTPRILTTSPINRVGFYVQDLINITEKLKILAGIRYTYQETESDVFTYSNSTTTNTKRFDDAFTPRFGIVYQPTTHTSLFASYANSFNLNTGIDTTGTALPPSFLNQYEVGIKNDLFKGLLSANITAYQIVNSNLAQAFLPANPTYPNAQELAGEVTSKGIEVDVMTKSLHGFNFIAGYSFNETKYTKSNIYIEGSRLRYNPTHTANASVYYTFDDNFIKGLNVGITAFYTGERVAGRSTRLTITNDTYRLIPLPDFTQIDASVGYTLDKISFRFKVSNVFDVLSYYVHDDNSVNPLAPRLFLGTLSYHF